MLDQTQQESIRELWREYDPTFRRRLPINELRMIFLGLGRDISDKDLNACAKGNSSASFDMVIEFLNALPSATATIDELRASAVVISNFSSFGDKLRTAELRAVLATQGDKLTMNECACLVSDCDDGYGFVNIEGFANLLSSGGNPQPR